MGQCCAHHDQKELEVHKTMNLISQNKDSHESFDCDVLMSENDDMEAKLLHEPDPKYASKINVIPEKLSTKIELLLREIDRFEYDADNDMVEKAIFLGARRLINNSIYVGQWFDRLRNGRGQQIMPDGSIYEGYWVNNKRQGKGRQIDYSGDYYIGEWNNDCAEGKGKFVQRSGAFYEGYWLNNKQNGKGVESWPTGEKFEGQYKEGCKHGIGIFRNVDGSFYEGNFVMDKIEGKGIIKVTKGPSIGTTAGTTKGSGRITRDAATASSSGRSASDTGGSTRQT